MEPINPARTQLHISFLYNCLALVCIALFCFALLWLCYAMLCNFEILDLEKIYTNVEDFLQNFPQISVDYFAIADENDLKPIKHKKKNQKYRAFIAADISGVRLIDNIKLY